MAFSIRESATEMAVDFVNDCDKPAPDEIPTVRFASGARLASRQFLRNPAATTGLVVLTLLCLAAVAASRAVRRWIAPLPVRARALTRVFLLPTFAAMIAASAVEAWLLMALGASFRVSAAVGFTAAVIGCLATFSGARFRDERPRGMP